MSNLTTRPVIFDYDNVPRFVADMLKWRRTEEPGFSIRNVIKSMPGCSPTLVTQVASGRRRLTRDRTEAFGRLLNLSAQEVRYLDQWIAWNRRVAPEPVPVPKRQGASATPILTAKPQQPKNNLVSHWLHAYVKEACRILGAKASPQGVHRVLGGIANFPQVKKSFEFLLKEGFLRRGLSGEIVQDEIISTTTDEIPVKKIRAFHKRALEIAKRGLDLYPPGTRRAETYILAVNEENLPKVKKILNECMDRLEEFEQDHPNQNERLYQVTLHMTPIGGKADAAE